jgi:membrane peptidoglycan carboxypeptidase
MRGVVLRGTGTAANPGRPAAGKTGTTSDSRDAWFIGYTPELVGLVWLGNDDNSPMSGGTTGGMVCAPLWKALMDSALLEFPPTPFPAALATVRTASADVLTRTRTSSGDAEPESVKRAMPVQVAPVPADTPDATSPRVEDEAPLMPPDDPVTDPSEASR